MYLCVVFVVEGMDGYLEDETCLRSLFDRSQTDVSGCRKCGNVRGCENSVEGGRGVACTESRL